MTNIQDVKHTVEVSSDVGRGCEHCDYRIGYQDPNTKDLAHSINHYMEQHGYRLLHVGTRTAESPDGKLWHITTAILGHDNPPAQDHGPTPDDHGKSGLAVI
jgi:hypothetical protein